MTGPGVKWPGSGWTGPGSDGWAQDEAEHHPEVDQLSKCLVSWRKGQADCLELGGPYDMWPMEHSEDTLGWLTFSFHPPSPLPA